MLKAGSGITSELDEVWYVIVLFQFQMPKRSFWSSVAENTCTFPPYCAGFEDSSK